MGSTQRIEAFYKKGFDNGLRFEILDTNTIYRITVNN